MSEVRGGTRRREVALERIVQAALGILGERGLDGLTMQGLAASLGYAVGALYRYFPSKDALIVALQRRIIDLLHAQLSDALAATPGGAGAPGGLTPQQAALLRVWVAARTYEAMALQRPAEFGLLSMTLGDPRPFINDKDAGQVAPPMARLFEVGSNVFQAAAQVAALKPGDATRRMLVLWTAMQGALQMRKLERLSAALDVGVLLDEAVTTLLLGWGAHEADVDAMRTRALPLLPDTRSTGATAWDS